MTKVLWMLSFVGLTMIPAHAAELKPGLQGEYWDRVVEVENFPILADTEKPDLTRIDAQINWESVDGNVLGTPWVDFVYARWNGKIRIPRDGKYRFFLNSDDGSRLWINGNVVVDNGGRHGMEEKSGEVELKAGDHDLKADFFEDQHGGGCLFSWSAPAIDKQIVPTEVLFHEAK